jgi:hypothetical protein
MKNAENFSSLGETPIIGYYKFNHLVDKDFINKYKMIKI